MGLPALIILILSVVVTAARMFFVHSTVDASVEFGTLLLNSLSLLWLGWVLAKNETVTNAKLGAAIRREMPTLVLALSTLLMYSVVRLIRIGFS